MNNMTRCADKRFKGLVSLLFCILFVAFAVFRCDAQTQNSNMKKQDFTQAGFSILLSEDPGFEVEFRRLGLGNAFDTLAIKSVSVILKNTSAHSVVAFTVKWTVLDGDGNTISRSFNYIQPSGLLDGGQPKRERVEGEHQIRPGEARFITAGGMVRKSDDLHEIAKAGEQITVKNVAIDLAIFDDGEVLGPNGLGTLELFEAHVNAEQDLMEEVDSRLGKGEALRNILLEIHARLGPDAGVIAATATDVYKHNLQAYLAELEATEHNFGEATARRAVAYHKYKVRPKLRRSSDTESKGVN